MDGLASSHFKMWIYLTSGVVARSEAGSKSPMCNKLTTLARGRVASEQGPDPSRSCNHEVNK